MKVLITGASGQLAKEFIKILDKNNYTVFPLTKEEFDICDLEKAVAAVSEIRPSLVLNCAAFNLVDEAEKRPSESFKVNSLGVKNLVYVCREFNCYLTHFSTDYVFDGEKKDGLYVENDKTNPINEYGKSKLEGERWVLEGGLEKFLIFRVSWVYGNGEKNFLFKILNWAKTQEYLKIAVDECSVPTSTRTIAEVSLKAIQKGLTGVYHLVNSGYALRYEWASEFIRLKGINKFIYPAYRSEFNLPAKRPRFSAMSNCRICKELNISIPEWKEEMYNYFRKIN